MLAFAALGSAALFSGLMPAAELIELIHRN
jgi:hypothetical protein